MERKRIFAIKVSDIVEEYYVKKVVAAKDKLLQKKEDKIDKLLVSQKKLTENFAKTERSRSKSTMHYRNTTKIARRNGILGQISLEIVGDTKIICKIEHTPNSINLWTRIRKNLKKRGKIDAKGCNFNLLGDFTEKKMLTFVENTHDERFNTSKL